MWQRLLRYSFNDQNDFVFMTIYKQMIIKIIFITSYSTNFIERYIGIERPSCVLRQSGN